MSNYKRSVSFLDGDRKLAELKLEITTRNGYPEFSISGNYANGGGQVQDHIKPANEKQNELLRIWDQWHLNGMSAGTKEQNEAIKNPDNWKRFKEGNTIQTIVFNTLFEKRKEELRPLLEKDWQDRYSVDEYFASQVGKNNIAEDIFNEGVKLIKKIKESETEYDSICYLLKWLNLYEVSHPVTNQPYKYGHGWIVKTLPDDFEESIDTLIDEIEELEEERKGEPLNKLDESDLLELIGKVTTFDDDRDIELCAALVNMFDLSENDLQDVEINGTNVTVQGTEYLAGTDDEMDDLWEQDLDNYLDEIVLPELPDTAQRYFDREGWKRDARFDGRAHSLNRYDGNEKECKINGTYYFAYRQ